MKKFDDEANFDEALNFNYYASSDNLKVITPELQEIFDLIERNSLEELISNSNEIMSCFFIICKALRM